MQKKIYSLLPNILQCGLISIFNYLAYKDRYGGKYQEFFKVCEETKDLSLDELLAYQKNRLQNFLTYSISNSKFYNRILTGKKFENFPIISKEDLRVQIKEVYTIDPKEGIKSKTGGTTGKSLEVYYTKEDLQERFAFLDFFRAQFGYKLGKKTAWFSGKSLLTNKDIKKNVFWKTDFLYNVRYYSTFHINNIYLGYYLNNLIKFNPEFFVGFPSTILEIARYGLNAGIEYPKGVLKAIFPTAETITLESRVIIEKFFKAKMYNQYASSEGAPFIFECVEGNLHMDLRTGIFEVLDNTNSPSDIGKLVLTSFTTKGTPLIRYDIGDSIELESKDLKCTCGNNNPLVKTINGRIDDYIYSPQTGKINLGNVSNTLKDTKGIIKFQVVQEELDSIKIFIITDPVVYTEKYQNIFIENWRERLGSDMKIKLIPVKEIKVENSGKFRIVKNSIKHLIK